MKKTFLFPAIVMLVIGFSEIQAQTTPSKPDQVQLMKLFIGNWQSDVVKDTSAYVAVKPFGTGVEFSDKYIVKGKTVSEEHELYGYDSKLDKYAGADLVKGRDVQIVAVWFTSNNKCIATYLSDASNPDKAAWKNEMEFKSPDIIVAHISMNGKLVSTLNFKKVK